MFCAINFAVSQITRESDFRRNFSGFFLKVRSRHLQAEEMNMSLNQMMKIVH